jgi:hypothetical protein
MSAPFLQAVEKPQGMPIHILGTFLYPFQLPLQSALKTAVLALFSPGAPSLQALKKQPEARPALKLSLPEGFGELDRSERAKVLADILSNDLRAAARKKVLEAVVAEGHLKEQEDWVALAEALMDKEAKQSGQRAEELLPFMKEAG